MHILLVNKYKGKAWKMKKELIFILIGAILLTGCSTFAVQECRPEIKIQENNSTYYIYTLKTDPMEIPKGREIIKVCPFNCSYRFTYSGSMRRKELSNISSMVGFKPLKQDEIMTGNSIVFYNDDKEIIHHRVVGRVIINNEVHFITKGDMNYFIDAYVVKFEDIIATAMREVDSDGIYN